VCCSSYPLYLHHVRRENTYSITVVSRIHLRIMEGTLLSVRLNAEQLDTSLLGPSLQMHRVGQCISSSDDRDTRQKGSNHGHDSTTYRHACADTL
jgi:hypothetical protein